jgi:hypothetical protein
MARKRVATKLFFEREVDENCPEEVARKLGHMTVDTDAMKKVRQAADNLGVKYVLKPWQGMAVAHIGFPDFKIAVFMNNRDRHRYTTLKKEWAEEGWTLVEADKAKIDESDLETVQNNLASLFPKKTEKGRR